MVNFIALPYLGLNIWGFQLTSLRKHKATLSIYLSEKTVRRKGIFLCLKVSRKSDCGFALSFIAASSPHRRTPVGFLCVVGSSRPWGLG